MNAYLFCSGDKSGFLATVICFATLSLISCAPSKPVDDLSGKIIIRMGYANYMISLADGKVNTMRYELPEVVYALDRSSGHQTFKRNSMSDDLSRTAYLEDSRHVYLYDVSSHGKRLMMNSAGEVFFSTPMISPNGRYLAIVEDSDGLESRAQRGSFINVLNLENGQTHRVELNPCLKELRDPGMIRWVSDSTGFTYNVSCEGSIAICLYDVETHKSTIVAKGSGGVLSSKRDNLMWLDPDNAEELRVSHLIANETYSRHIEDLVDYAWSPTGSHVVILENTASGSTVIISDNTLKETHIVVNHGPDMRSWEIYFTPIRWLP